jgi:hypothetical protein
MINTCIPLVWFMSRSIVGGWLQRRAAKHSAEARLAKWKRMQMAGIVLLVIGVAFEVLASILPLSFLKLALLGFGIPIIIPGLIFTIAFSVKISELKRLNPGLASPPAQGFERRVATRIPRTLGSLEREQLDKLKALFKVSERVKIDDIASMLGTSRKDAFDKLLVLSKTVNFQINEDVVIIEKGQTDALISELDKQFGDWGNQEQTKSGKI